MSHPNLTPLVSVLSYVTNPRVDAEAQMISRAALIEALPIVLTNCILDSLHVPFACYGRKEFCYTKAVLIHEHRLLVTKRLIAHFCCFEDEDSAVDFVSRLWIIKVPYFL